MNTVNPVSAAAAQPLRDAYRAAMRRFASTVAIVTAGSGDDYTGMAATAVMSVTADPPALLVAVNRTASIMPYLSDGELFCVNILAERHSALVSAFGGALKGKERFSVGAWRFDGRAPVLEDAAASLLCRKVLATEYSTHTVFTGEVEEVITHPSIEPLVWVDGAVARVERL